MGGIKPELLDAAFGGGTGSLGARATDPERRRQRAAPFESHINAAASRYGLDPNLLRAVIEQESGFDPAATRYEPKLKESSYGLMQLLESTARGLGYEGAPEGLADPATNIDLGARYLAEQIGKAGGVEGGLSAYNGGFGRAGYGRPNPDGRFNNQEYVDTVNGRYSAFASIAQSPDSLLDAAFGPPKGEKPKRKPSTIDEIEDRLAGRSIQREGLLGNPLTPEEKVRSDLTMQDKKPGESRRAFLERTQKVYDKVSEAVNFQHPTIGAAPTGFKRFKNSLANLKFLSGGKLFSTEQSPGGIPLGQPIGLAEQILTPTVGKVVEGEFGQAFDNFVGIAGNFGKALFDPLVRYPVGLLYDQMAGEDYLLPEERGTWVRSTVANYAGLLVGYGARQVYNTSRTGVLSAGGVEQLGMRDLAALKEVKLPTGFRARAARGALEGGAGGFTTGFLDTENNEERLNLGMSYALMGMPLGWAFEGLSKNHISLDEAVKENAKELFHLRQLRTATSTTPDQAAANMLNMTTTGDLARSVARTALDIDKPVVVSGLSADEVQTLKIDMVKHQGDVELLGRKEPLPESQEAAASVTPDPGQTKRVVAPEYKLPAAVVKSAPRFGYGQKQFELDFASDFDRAAYILQGTVQSKAHNQILADVMEKTGLSADEITAHGRKVREHIKERAKTTEAGKLQIAKQENAPEFKSMQEATTSVKVEEAPTPVTTQPTDIGRVLSVHKRADGLHDVAFIPSRIQESALKRSFFAQSGFMPDEIINVRGKKHRFVGLTEVKGETKALIRRPAGEKVSTAKLSDIQRLGDGVDFATPEAVQNQLYGEFRKFAPKLFAGELPEGDFNKLVREFARSKRIPPTELEGLVGFLGDMAAVEMRSFALSPVEHGLYEALVNEIADWNTNNAIDLVDLATANGMYVDTPDGAIGVMLRDSETGSAMGSFKSNEAARQFIINSGAPTFVDLDNGGSNIIPPSSLGRDVMVEPPPPNGPHKAAFIPEPDSWMREASHAYNTSALGRLTTGPRQVAIALDSREGTTFNAVVIEPMRLAVMKKHAAMRPALDELSTISKLARGFDADQVKHMDDLVRISADKPELVDPVEVDIIKKFLELEIDPAKVVSYIAASRQLKNKLSITGHRGEQAALEALRGEMGINKSHEAAAKLLEEILHANQIPVSAYRILRNYDSIRLGEPLSFDDYVKQHNVHPKVAQVAKMIVDQRKKVAKEIGLPEWSMLRDHYPYYRILEQDDVTAISPFVRDLLNAQELVDYDMNPVAGSLRLTNAAYNEAFVNPTLKTAKKYIDAATVRLTDGDAINRYLNDHFLNEIMGTPQRGTHTTHRAFANKLMGGFAKKLGLAVGERSLKNLVDTWLSIGSAAAVGFRPMQGIRDAVNFISNFYARFGARRTANMLISMSKTEVDELVRAGIIPGNTPINVLTPEEQAIQTLASKTSTFRTAMHNVADKGIKWGLQHNIYQWSHAAAYTESYKEAITVLNKMSKGAYGAGEVAKARAYKRLKINSYDLPVIREFDHLVTAGEFDNAAKFLGHASSFETVPTFGLASHPVGWSTVSGRLLGQYGSFAVWQRVQLSRLLSRGTVADRVGAGTRFAMSQGALKLASWAAGLNLSSWYLAPGALGFRGGPAASTLGNISTLLAGSEREHDAAVHELSRLWMLGIPGSYAVRDVYEATELARQGRNPISAVARAVGVRSLKEPSLLNPYGIPK